MTTLRKVRSQPPNFSGCKAPFEVSSSVAFCPLPNFSGCKAPFEVSSSVAFCPLPNSSGSKATFRDSSTEATRSVCPLPNLSGVRIPPDKLVVDGLSSLPPFFHIYVNIYTCSIKDHVFPGSQFCEWYRGIR